MKAASQTIEISSTLTLDLGEITFEFVRSGGPGGQNVNKVATAVRLRLDLHKCQSLPEAVKGKLNRLAGKRINKEGVLVITSQKYRHQERNRQDAIEKLKELLIRAATKPKPHIKTKVPFGAKQQRLENKKRRGLVKKARHFSLDQMT